MGYKAEATYNYSLSIGKSTFTTKMNQVRARMRWCACDGVVTRLFLPFSLSSPVTP